MNLTTRNFRAIAALLPLIFLLIVGCSSPKAEKPKAPETPQVTLEDPLRYAVVTEAPRLQFMYSEQCPTEVRARFKDKDGNYPHLTILSACSLQLETCDRIETGYLLLKQPDGSFVKTNDRIVLRVEQEVAPDDFICNADGSGSDDPMNASNKKPDE